MPAAATDYFTEVGNPGTATTLAAPGHSIAGTSINVVSTSNWPTTTGAIFAMDQYDVSTGLRVPGTYTEWEGVVGSNVITAMVLRYGTDQNYSAGTTTRVYIPVSSARENRMAQGILVDHSQSGGHEILINYDPSNPTLETQKWVGVASAVNEFSVSNAAAGNAPQAQATGGDTNIDLRLVPKGTGNVKRGASGGSIDWWEELGRTTLGVAGDTISVASLPTRKYLRVLVSLLNSGQIGGQFRFNNDSGAKYNYRLSVNGGADSTASGGTSLALFPTESSAQMGQADIVNISAQEKLVYFSAVTLATAGNNFPTRAEGGAKFTDTSAPITRVDIVNGGTGDFAIGSEVIVLGHD